MGKTLQIIFQSKFSFSISFKCIKFCVWLQNIKKIVIWKVKFRQLLVGHLFFFDVSATLFVYLPLGLALLGRFCHEC
jgi:hypothetical protein